MPVARQMTQEEVRKQIEEFSEAIKIALLRRLETRESFLMLTDSRVFSADLDLSEVLKGFIDIAVLSSAEKMNHERVAEPFSLETLDKHLEKVNQEWDHHYNIIHNIICYQMVKRHELGEEHRRLWRARFGQEYQPKVPSPEDVKAAQETIMDDLRRKAVTDVLKKEDAEHVPPPNGAKARTYTFSATVDQTGLKKSSWTPMTQAKAKKVVREHVRVEADGKTKTWTKKTPKKPTKPTAKKGKKS